MRSVPYPIVGNARIAGFPNPVPWKGIAAEVQGGVFWERRTIATGEHFYFRNRVQVKQVTVTSAIKQLLED